jgi:hypothetical protein
MLEVERMNKKIKQNLCTGVRHVKCHGLFHIVFVLNKHMPFGGEQLVFGLAHISWWVYWI